MVYQTDERAHSSVAFGRFVTARGSAEMLPPGREIPSVAVTTVPRISRKVPRPSFVLCVLITLVPRFSRSEYQNTRIPSCILAKMILTATM